MHPRKLYGMQEVIEESFKVAVNSPRILRRKVQEMPRPGVYYNTGSPIAQTSHTLSIIICRLENVSTLPSHPLELVSRLRSGTELSPTSQIRRASRYTTGFRRDEQDIEPTPKRSETSSMRTTPLNIE